MDSVGTWPLGNRDWVSARFQDQDLISKNYGPLFYKGETRKVDNQNKKGKIFLDQSRSLVEIIWLGANWTE